MPAALCLWSLHRDSTQPLQARQKWVLGLDPVMCDTALSGRLPPQVARAVSHLPLVADFSQQIVPPGNIGFSLNTFG
jgi:hypothetical protein